MRLRVSLGWIWVLRVYIKNTLAQQASGYNVTKKYFNIRKPMQTKAEFLVLDASVRPVSETGLTAQTGLTGDSAIGSDSAKKDDLIVSTETQDWRVPLISYLRDPGRGGAERNIRHLAFKYVLIDDELYRRTAEDLLLKCLDSDHARVAMGEVHEGICGTHQSAPKMKWLLRRAGFYWLTMLSDCFKYYKGCEECQWFENLQFVPTALMHSIIKPWPFRGWGLDFIGQINPPSSKGHCFVLVDYFTKWTEAVPLKNMTHKEVIEFITEHIIHIFLFHKL